MAKTLIIDGYNLLFAGGAPEGRAGGDISESRSRLVKAINRYCFARGLKATIVFDGGQRGYPLEQTERHFGVEVVYSRKGETADHVIKRMIEAHREKVILISSDAELMNFAQARRVTAVTSRKFEKLLHEAVRRKEEAGFDKSEDEDRAASVLSTKKKGNPRRPPKKRRKNKRDIDKL